MVEPTGDELAAALDPGVRVPVGHRLVTLGEAPELLWPIVDHNTAGCTELMRESTFAAGECVRVLEVLCR
jgi:hypothetical protein